MMMSILLKKKIATKRHKRHKSLLCAFCAFLWLTLPLFGQSSTATILGTITDSSGAAVPGVTVTFRGSSARPNYVAGCDPTAHSTVDHWFDATCFTLPAVGFNGNFGRNVLIGPRLTDADLALLKSVKFAEDKTVQVRAEVFNVANHPNFGLPGGAVFSQGAVAGTGNVNPTYGRITSTRTTSRQVQLGFKFIF